MACEVLVAVAARKGDRCSGREVGAEPGGGAAAARCCPREVRGGRGAGGQEESPKEKVPGGRRQEEEDNGRVGCGSKKGNSNLEFEFRNRKCLKHKP